MKYKKTGGGILRIGNRVIQPGQTFEVEDEQILDSFRDSVKSVGLTRAPTKISKEKETYTKQDRGYGWWNVLDSKGQLVNEDALRENEADDLISKLKKQ